MEMDHSSTQLPSADAAEAEGKRLVGENLNNPPYPNSNRKDDTKDDKNHEKEIAESELMVWDSNKNKEEEEEEEEGEERGGRGKREEWSEGAVRRLLEAYEEKWKLRRKRNGKGKLKGSDWQDVSRHVSTRPNASKSLQKTHTQCKNKIESLKKRFRCVESAHHNSSAAPWPFFSRLHRLLRSPSLPNNIHLDQPIPNPIEEEPNTDSKKQTQKASVFLDTHTETGSEDCRNRDLGKAKSKGTEETRKRKRWENERGMEDGEVGRSLRCMTESIVKAERVKMDIFRDLARLRAETEMRRCETELKCTQILSNTQLEIARLLSSNSLSDFDSGQHSDEISSVGSLGSKAGLVLSMLGFMFQS
eukprot:TRINITY_DN2636_c1_g1_i3.p1 TRINITY_DN2636_c1_g1~~TRINITY_DN2636_c1_g1_i3.p1  ORF type:complete len:361 (+),score=74.09 TRINITY_DN2636_c1_g1_i3:228-1310(+)